MAIRETIHDQPPRPIAARGARRHRRALAGRRLAVRSSASREDSRENSFAGQLDSVLEWSPAPRSGRRARVGRRCVERCLDYQRRRGMRLQALGVIVCEQIEARFAGVLFTRAPAGCAPASMRIEYCEGLGDKLASGT